MPWHDSVVVWKINKSDLGALLPGLRTRIATFSVYKKHMHKRYNTNVLYAYCIHAIINILQITTSIYSSIMRTHIIKVNLEVAPFNYTTG